MTVLWGTMATPEVEDDPAASSVEIRDLSRGSVGRVTFITGVCWLEVGMFRSFMFLSAIPLELLSWEFCGGGVCRSPRTVAVSIGS